MKKYVLLSVVIVYSASLTIAFAQEIVRGRITDSATGEPLVGATVAEIGIGGREVITDNLGDFMLNVSDLNASVVAISYVGYRSIELRVDGRKLLNASLDPDMTLDEVVVIGYGQVKKRDLTGAVASLKFDELQNTPMTRLDQAMQGRIAGVQVTNISGAPGEGATIRIRGGNSITAGNEPLYVVDGFIGAGDLNTINPNDIESIEVLKDASATAIYGSRGSNGVVLITTKRGSNFGSSGLSYEGFIGIQSLEKRIDLLDGNEYALFRNEYGEFVGTSVPFPDINSVSNTDWQDVLFKTASMNNHNFGIFSTNSKSNYYISGNYLDQEGIQIGSSFTRYQARMNFDYKFSSVFRAGAVLTVAKSDRENPRAVGITTHVLPTSPIYNSDGSYFSTNPINGATFNSPIAQNDLILDETGRLRALGNFYVELDLFKDLRFRSTLGFDIDRTKRNRYASTMLPVRKEAGVGGYAMVNTNFANTLQNENTLNYSKTFGENDLSFLVGWTAQSYAYEGAYVSAQGFTNDVTGFNAIQMGNPALVDVSSDETRWAMLSSLYRLNYTLKSRYLLTVSGRHDGSSRLTTNKRWQFFPSAAFAWRLSDEEFMQNVRIFDDLKFRVSYGQTGSQSIAPYTINARLNSDYVFLGNERLLTFFPATPSNPYLRWETTSQLDIGLDVGILKNRLKISLDYYDKTTSDLLLTRELAGQTGFSNRLENVGSLQNNGWELAMDGVIVNTPTFLWNTGLTLATNSNKVLNLYGDKNFLDNGIGSRIMIGQPVGVFTGIKYLGVWQEGDEGLGSQSPGSPKFLDLDGNGVINDNDVQVIGKGIPDIYGGISNTFGYRNFSLTCFIDFSAGNDIYDLNGRQFNTGHSSNVYGKYRNRWTSENQHSNIPRAGSMQTLYWESISRIGTDMDVYDGSFIRLKSLSLQYDFEKPINRLNDLSIFVSGTNIFTFTKYIGFSPDINSEGTNPSRRGFDDYNLPQARIFQIGVRATFN